MTPDRVVYAVLGMILSGITFFGVWGVAADSSLHGTIHSSDLPKDQETISSLNVRVELLRSGKVKIEQEFVIDLVEGGDIRRGPILSYLTVYRGVGDLVLHTRMEVEEILRDGNPEPFRVEDHGGITRIVCGAADTFLAPGPHHYTVRYERNSDWVYRNGQAHWTFDVTESFKHFSIQALSFELTLPEGIEFAYCTPALSGGEMKGGIGYEAEEQPGRFEFRTTAPLPEPSYCFLNAGWESNGFATQSQWLEVMKQHPKLPLTFYTALVFFAALIGLLIRIVKNQPVRPVEV